jgi:integrase
VAGQHRERRLSGDELFWLLEAADESKAATLTFCITIAVETGMRAGEIVSLRWEDIDMTNTVVRLGMTKNGDRRIVPLTEAAVAAINSLPRPIQGGRITSFYDSRGLSAAFRRTCERAGITDLHFHDLRHEAASRLAPRMPVATLAKIMGWKTVQMAMRYYNPTAAELVAAVRAAA